MSRPVRILHLVSSLGPNEAGRAVSRIVPSLPTDRFESKVVNLGGSLFELPGLADQSHRLRYPVDLARFVAVRRTLAAFDPDVVHAWGSLSVYLTALLRADRLVISHADRTTDPIAHWLNGRANAIVAMNKAEESRYLVQGIVSNRLQLLPHGLEPITTVDRTEVRKSLGLPEDAVIIVASGGYDVNARLHHAVWAFDIVRYLHPKLHLVVLGDGPNRGDVERFSRMLGKDDHRVLFTGIRADAERIIAAADACWVTHKVGGVTVAVEALAHGVPVFAYRTPDTETLPTEATKLIPALDSVALSAETNRWLNSRSPVVPFQFPLGTLVTSLVSVYDDVNRY